MPETLQPRVVQLDGPGRYVTPPVIAVRDLIVGARGSPIRVCLTLEDGSELQVPLAPHLIRELLGLLKPFDPALPAQSSA